MKQIDIADLDCIYLSYQEPEKEEFWVKIKNMVPWAKRVDGVKGSDAAHKACAELSDTDRFVVIDGDNMPNAEFFNQTLELDNKSEHAVFRWRAKNYINGLMYGNGGLSCWTKEFVQNMRTHENTDGTDETQIEFCYFDKYYQLPECYSTSIINSTPSQAWRAGFREGVKMSLNRGTKVQDVANETWWQNYHRLLIWMNVGMDVVNGEYAILGAREGCYKVLGTDWDHSQTRDFTILNQLWEEKCFKESPAIERITHLGQKLQELELPISKQPLDAKQSEFFKTVYINTERVLGRKF